ncbi:MAG: secondary thiamine-phosphate synthase enzyme YjbQ [Pseudomonadota bacterium]|nr:secondary thiamine-phosphate synthase enzyme YjbQ [Pseudomonadota bacterium]
MRQSTLTLATPGRGLHDITGAVQDAVTGVKVGLCHLFLQHTSASLLVQENWDPDVLRDLEDWFARIAPDGDPRHRHQSEGPDDMPSHIRSAITATSLTIPVTDGQLALGRWQAIYLFEHRTRPHTRRVVVTLVGG